MNRADYLKIRKQLRPGDVIAFAGRSVISRLIGFGTRSRISHVGIVIRTKDEWNNERVELLESTSLYGKKGVQKTFLSDHVRDYPGGMYALLLLDHLSMEIDTSELWEIVKQENGKKYDYWGAWWSWLTDSREGAKRRFCSELVIYFFRALDLIRSINAEAATPQDVVSFDLWREYIQLTGKRRPLPGFNTVNPEGFGL